MEIADRMRDLRVQAGLTKTALARPRYTVSFVSQIEAGRRRPSPEALEFFAGRLGVTPRYLSTGIPDELETELLYQLEAARRELLEKEPADAERTLLTVLARAEEYGLKPIRSRCLLLKGEIRLRQGRAIEAIDLLEEALDGELPEREAGKAIWVLARAHSNLGDLQFAAELIETFLKKDDRGPLDPTVAAELQSTLVSIYFERGDVFQAQRAAERAVAAASAGISIEIRAEAFWHASRVLAEAKKWDQALEYASRARALMEEINDRRSVGEVHNAYAFICLEADPPRLKDAREHLKEAERLLAQAGQPGDLTNVFTEWGRLALMEGRFDEAFSWAEKSESVTLPDNELGIASTLFLRGRATAALGRDEEAREALSQAAQKFRTLGARQREAACWRELGELDRKAGRLDESVESLLAGLEALDPRRSRT